MTKTTLVTPGAPQPIERAEELALAGFRVHHRHRPIRIGDAEEVEQERQAVGQRSVEVKDGPLDGGPGRDGIVVLRDPELGAQQLEHRHEGHGRSMGEGVGAEDVKPPGPARLGELVTQTALADPRTRHHADDLAVALGRPGEGRLEGGHLPRPAHEPRETPGGGHLERGAQRPPAHNLEDRERITALLGLHGAQVPQLEIALHQSGGGGGDIDRAGLGQRFHSLGQPDGCANGRVLHVLVVVDGPGHDLARVQPHPHVEVDTALPLELAAVDGQLLPQMKGGGAGLPGVVLVGDGRPEEGHDPVASELVDVTVEAGHAVAQDGEEATHELAPVLQFHRGGEVHGVDHVGEEDGDLLALRAPDPGSGCRLEGSRGRSRRVGRSPPGVEGRILAKDGGLHLPDGLSRFEPQLVGQQAPQVLVGPQRLSVASRAVEGQHAQKPQPLPEGVGAGERLELPGHEAMVPHREVGLDAVLDGGQSSFLQSARFRSGGRGVCHLGQGGAAPECQRLSERPGRLGVVAGGGPLPSLGAQRFEPEGVDRLVVDLQPVPRRTGPERVPVLSQGLAEAGDVDPQGGGGAGRRVARPEILGQGIGGDDTVGGQDKQRQEGAFPRALQAERVTVPQDLKRAQNPVFQRHALPRDARTSGSW